METIDVNILQNRERHLVEPLWEKQKQKSKRDKSDITDVHAISSEQPQIVVDAGDSKLIKIDDRFTLAPMKWIEDQYQRTIDMDKDYSSKVGLSPCCDHFDDQYDIKYLVTGAKDSGEEVEKIEEDGDGDEAMEY